jgi:flagellar basal-body rod modification protein FlgD
MTPVSASTPAASSPLDLGTSASGGADLGRDEFLQLLVAQLRNQDPTSPQDGHEFAAQLAQFSSVEQLTSINAAMESQAERLAALSDALGGLQTGQAELGDQLAGRIDLQAASGLVGKTVEVEGGAVSFDGAGEVPLRVRVGGDAREVEVTVRDAEGAVVRTMRTGALGAGDHDLTWDGALQDGQPAPAGDYSVEVRATGADGAPVQAAPVSGGAVERITVEAGGVFLWVGGRPVPFDRLLSVSP